MKTAESKYFHNIKGLMVPKKCDYDRVHKNINRYIDVVQSLSKALEKSFREERYEFFIRNMDMAQELLCKIYARWLETEGEVILRCVKSGRAEQVKSRVGLFIGEMLALSIEMQRMQNIEDEEPETDGTVERHADMAHNLSAVGTRIGEGDYEQARSMIVELEEYSAEAMLVNLLDLVASKKYGEAEKLANLLKEKHVNEIKAFAVSAGETRKVILAVDDRPEILSGINAALKGRYKVFGVTDGELALQFLQTQTPDLFILDIDMPGMDGYELSGAIRKIAAHKETPIIFLTGNSSREHVLKAMRAGGNDFLVKPAGHEVLLTKTGKYLA